MQGTRSAFSPQVQAHTIPLSLYLLGPPGHGSSSSSPQSWPPAPQCSQRWVQPKAGQARPAGPRLSQSKPLRDTRSLSSTLLSSSCLWGNLSGHLPASGTACHRYWAE